MARTSLKSGAANEASAPTKAGILQTLGITLSTTGGASATWKSDSSGNWTTGAFANDGIAMSTGGNIRIPDMRGLQWLKRDGTPSGYCLYPWEMHDGYGGELILKFPWRFAMVGTGAVQFGSNASLRDAQHFHMTCGASTVSDTLRSSKAISMQVGMWVGGVDTTRRIMTQAVPLGTGATDDVVRTYFDATIVGENGGYNATNGNVSGTLASELHRDGLWTPGTAPAFVSLADGATITQTCSKYKVRQVAKVTLGGNRTLAISGAVAGMTGTIIVRQDGTGSRTLALPMGSIRDSAWALSTAANAYDRLTWEYDGTNYFWTMQKGLVAGYTSQTSDWASRASVVDTTILTAVDNLVIALTNAGIWAKCLAFYPFAGGTATAHAQNLVQNLYNITWVGSPTHASNGVTGNGTSSYGNTGINLATIGGYQDNFAGYAYAATSGQITDGSYLWGAVTTTTRLGVKRSGSGVAAEGPNNLENAQLAYTSGGDWRHQILLNRSASNASQLYVDANSNTRSVASVEAPNTNIFILAQGYIGTPYEFTNANLRGVAFFTSLNSAERTTLFSAMTAYNTALGRV